MKNKLILLLLIGILIFSSAIIIIPTLSTTEYEVMDNLPTVSDFTSSSLLSGYYSDDKKIVNDSNYIRFNKYVTMNTNSFRINLPNEYIRMIIKEYDSNNNFIKSTDLAHLDYFTKQNNTTYLLLYFYKMDNLGNLVTSNYDTLYSTFTSSTFSFTEIADLGTDEYLKSDESDLSLTRFRPSAQSPEWKPSYEAPQTALPRLQAHPKQSCILLQPNPLHPVPLSLVDLVPPEPLSNWCSFPLRTSPWILPAAVSKLSALMQHSSYIQLLSAIHRPFDYYK